MALPPWFPHSGALSDADRIGWARAESPSSSQAQFAVTQSFLFTTPADQTSDLTFTLFLFACSVHSGYNALPLLISSPSLAQTLSSNLLFMGANVDAARDQPDTVGQTPEAEGYRRGPVESRCPHPCPGGSTLMPGGYVAHCGSSLCFQEESET